MIEDKKYKNSINLLNMINKSYEWIMKSGKGYVISKDKNTLAEEGILEHYLFIDEESLDIDFSFLDDLIYYPISTVIELLKRRDMLLSFKPKE